MNETMYSKKANSLNKNEIFRKKQIDSIFINETILIGDNVNIIYSDSNEKKICFAVSRKIKRATKKNKLKRQLREIYRTNKRCFPQNKNMMIIAKKSEAKFIDLKTELLSYIVEKF